MDGDRSRRFIHLLNVLFADQSPAPEVLEQRRTNLNKSTAVEAFKGENMR